MTFNFFSWCWYLCSTVVEGPFPHGAISSVASSMAGMLGSIEGHFLWYKQQPDKDDGGLEGHAPKKGKQVYCCCRAGWWVLCKERKICKVSGLYSRKLPEKYSYLGLPFWTQITQDGAPYSESHNTNTMWSKKSSNPWEWLESFLRGAAAA